MPAEFCPRGSMYQLLHAPSVHLSWRQIYFMCLGVAKGMAHLHSQNILHRDLKSGTKCPSCIPLTASVFQRIPTTS
jgi:serine/threonine protein kinase